ncbi:MAG: hypothetical protein IJ572_04605 [Bacilli bacterium]|nr:hypothetical protein [Bacilli bacterium]
MSTAGITKIEKGSGFTEDWVPIKAIQNGMILLNSGEYVTGIKVSPKNIFILDQGAQDNVIYNLRNFYNTLDFEFWIIIADRPVDINMYLAQLQLLYQRTTNNVIRKIIMQDINKANQFMGAEFNVIDTEYFILFKEKRPEIIQKRIHNMIGTLANAGLNSTQVSNADIRMILDNFLNGGTTTNFGTVMA